MAYTVAARLSNLLRVAKGGRTDEDKEEAIDTIKDIVKEFLPSGSGFDSGTTIDLVASTPEKLVFHTEYHHMNECGMYDGWTYHTVKVTPSFVYGLEIKVGGRDKNDTKDYIGTCFEESLSAKAPTHY